MDVDEFHGFWSQFERGFNTVWITEFQHDVACRIWAMGAKHQSRRVQRNIPMCHENSFRLTMFSMWSIGPARNKSGQFNLWNRNTDARIFKKNRASQTHWTSFSFAM